MHFEILCPLKAVGREGWEDDSSLRAGFNTLSLTSMFKQNVKACKPPDQWKIARVSAAFQKGWEEDRTCYRPLSMLSIPSKLMESYVASNITNRMVTQNLLVDRQWAYRKGKSTEQPLIHLTGRWREAVERKLLWEYCLWISLKLSIQCRTIYCYKSWTTWESEEISGCGEGTTLQNEDNSSESTDLTPIHTL